MLERSSGLMRPFFKPLWVGRGGFGWVWRGVEHQVYRNLDGSMPKRINHYTMPFTEEED